MSCLIVCCALGGTLHSAPWGEHQNDPTHVQAVQFIHGHVPDHTNHLAPIVQVAPIGTTNVQQVHHRQPDPPWWNAAMPMSQCGIAHTHVPNHMGVTGTPRTS